MANTPQSLTVLLALLTIIGSCLATEIRGRKLEIKVATKPHLCLKPRDGTSNRLPLIKTVDGSADRARVLDYYGLPKSLLLVGPKNYALPKEYREHASSYYNFPPKSCDVFLVSYPRSGHNWVSQLIWLLKHKINVTAASCKPLSQRVPLLEMDMLRPDKAVSIDSLPSPRVIRSQLPLSLIPHIANSAKKIIYLVRNPKDVIVANYRYIKNHHFGGSLENYFYWIQQNLAMYSSYWAHIREALVRKSNPNILIIYASEKPSVLVSKVAKFLGVSYSQEQLIELKSYLNSVDQIDKRSWKTEFSPVLNRRVNRWIKEHECDVNFPDTPDLLS